MGHWYHFAWLADRESDSALALAKGSYTPHSGRHNIRLLLPVEPSEPLGPFGRTSYSFQPSNSNGSGMVTDAVSAGLILR
jgi:hypothetical protein